MEDVYLYALNNKFTLLFYPREWKSLSALEHIPIIIISMASDLEDFFFFLARDPICIEIFNKVFIALNYLNVCALYNEGNVVQKYHEDLKEKNMLMVLDPWDT